MCVGGFTERVESSGFLGARAARAERLNATGGVQERETSRVLLCLGHQSPFFTCVQTRVLGARVLWGYCGLCLTTLQLALELTHSQHSLITPHGHRVVHSCTSKW